MKIKSLHDWNLSYAQAVELQKNLANQIRLEGFEGFPSVLGGIDCSISTDGSKIIAGIVVMETQNWQIIEQSHAITEARFPYVPGFLSFREAPGCIEAAKRLKKQPDVFIVDGQGIAHPRKLGLASHLGLFFGIPTIGCAKSRLTGKYKEFKLKKGKNSILWAENEQIGRVLCTRNGVKPVFVSPGNGISIEKSVEIVLKSSIKYRLPEPTRQAHLLVSKLRKT